MDSLVIIPTYNEIENIQRMLDAVMALEPSFDVLVVDDGSPDGTAGIVKESQATYPHRIHLLQRTGKLGLGTAYIAGFKWALEKDYGLIYEMDCDFSHNPRDLIRLREACVEGADVAVGSRYVKGGGISNWPLGRILMSYLASVYVNSILWLGVKDSTAGFKCYRKEVLQRIDLDRIQFIGYAFQIEMKYNAKRLGFRIKEVPITFSDREFGTSKMSMGIFREAFLGVIQMRFRAVKANPTST
ncbi:MAG: polyprenol monophosphomannose synthase [Flavobacteriales bacterium]|nr:polyprenol monophosphomannose synthase [Flavobacteriales bacterium]